MQTIYEMNGAGRLTGRTRDVEDHDPAPRGWTFNKPPSDNLTVWQANGAGYELVIETDPGAAPAPAESLAAFEKAVDRDTDAIYLAAIGNRWPEYDEAAREATQYRDAGYPVDAAPDSVSSWATAKGQTAQWAADDILAAAARLTGAKKAIRSHRLAAKEAARALPPDGTGDELTAIASDWANFVAYIRSQLGV